MKRLYILSIVLCFCHAITGQVNGALKGWVINGGLNLTVPFKMNEAINDSSDIGYRQLNVKNEITSGFQTSVGYEFHLNRWLTVSPFLGINFFQRKKQVSGEEYVNGCVYSQYFRGTRTYQTQYTNLFADLRSKIYLGRFFLESTIGTLCLIRYTGREVKQDENGISSANYSDLIMRHYYLQWYSSHKLGFVAVKNKIDFSLGPQFIYGAYSKYFLRSYILYFGVTVKL